METTDSHYEGLPDDTHVLHEISSMDELQIGGTYFNPQNGKLFMSLGKAISPDDLKVKFIWNEIDSVSGETVKSADEQAFSLPLIQVQLPDGFLKFMREKTPEA